MLRPVLLACSHGTDNPTGQRVVSSVLDQVRVLLPDVEVIETYVDVQFPQIDTVLLEVPHHRDVIVVPVLLSAGYHVHHDIAQAVAARNEATGPRSQAVATPALGPHPLLADLVVDRLRQGGVDRGDVVFAAAGSSDARASADVEAMVDLVSQRWQGAVTPGYCSAASPRVGEVITPTTDAVANYLLAPGFFDDRLHKVADPLGVTVSAPLGHDPRVAQVIVDRYCQAEQH